MENLSIMISVSMFILSTLADLIIFGVVFFMFYKLFKVKEVVIENNREIFDHDKALLDIQEQIKNG